ncbi:MAG TPA: TerC family protein [Miltoncostaeaceae bacterium]|nr:TerC family protein [Miltoncostaeaceae bacterium]
MAGTPLWAWAAVVAVALTLIAVDLLLHRDPKAVSMREAGLLSAGYLAVGLGFGAVLWAARGPEDGGEYYAGYLIEKALSLDNVFVFALILGAFAIPAELQHRVLMWGVIGALAFRAVFIAVGAVALDRFDVVAYALGALLVWTGVAMARGHEPRIDPSRSRALRVMGRFIPFTDGLRGSRFTVREAGRRMATPLLAALVAIETADIVFALDSVPAIFAITTDPFIVFTANVFAILGLRALYFLLAGAIPRFRYLKAGLATLLVLVGVKMLLTDVGKLPVWISLGAVVLVLAVSIGASLVAERRARAA